jgi:acetyl esterase/lipase
MTASGAAGRLLVGMAVVALAGGCTSGTSPTPVPDAPTPASLPSAAAATPAPTPTATPSVVVTSNFTYESTNPELTPDALDVYAPAKAGPWPVVVMFHGMPGGSPAADRANLSEEARRVADLGFVVFNASRGHGPGMAADPPTYDGLLAVQSQAACAVEYARAHAAEYGGDPATMIVFGHSGGSHAAAMVTHSPAPRRRRAASGAPPSARSTPWLPGKATGYWPSTARTGTALSPPTRGSSTPSRRGGTSPRTRTRGS